jgi:hypothetical protein
MKTFFIFLIPLLFLPGISACGQNPANTKNQKETAVTGSNVDVYYLHFTRRCVSCINVQNAAEKVLKDHYARELSEGTIVFHEINLSEPESREIAQMLDVGGQGLLVVNGDKKFDLTMQGFMYAGRDYDRFEKEMVDAISRAKN